MPQTTQSPLHQSLCDHFGCHSLKRVIESPEFAHAFNDSVQPTFCTKCGAEGDDLEPDVTGVRCDECGENAVAALSMLLIMGELG